MYVFCFLYIFFILITLHFWRASLLPTSQDHHLTTIITWKPGRLSIMTLDSEPPRFQLLNSIHTTMYVFCFLYIFFILISLHFWRASLLPTSQDHHLTTIITWKPGRLSIMTLDSEPPRFQLLNSIHTTMYVFCFLYIFFILISLHFWRASLLPTSQDHQLPTIIIWKPGRLSKNSC